MGPPVHIDDVAAVSSEVRAAVLDNLSDGVYIVDRERRILYWNRAAERITGFGADEVVGRCCQDGILVHCDRRGKVLCGDGCPLLATLCDARVREAHVYLHHKDGHRAAVCVRAAALCDAAGDVVGAVETFHEDATLAGWIEQRRRFQRSFGAVFADIDHFKCINDRFGHLVGDEALRLVARTLADTSRESDEVIRWGGDEFLLLVGDSDGVAIAALAERLRIMVQRTELIVEESGRAASRSSRGLLPDRRAVRILR